MAAHDRVSAGGRRPGAAAVGGSFTLVRDGAGRARAITVGASAAESAYADLSQQPEQSIVLLRRADGDAQRVVQARLCEVAHEDTARF
jgi:hypothetical protein